MSFTPACQQRPSPKNHLKAYRLYILSVAFSPMTTPDQQEELNQFEKIPSSDLIKTDDGYSIFNPYNPFNVEIKESDIKAILTRYGLPPIIANMEVYKRAFVHRSYLKYPAAKNEELGIIIAEQPPDCLPLKTKSNERLEFIGDGVLELITKYYLYRRFPKANEGFMTDKKIAIVKNEAIGRICYEMGLQRWLILSKNAEEKKVRTDFKRLGCLFESFLGAVFLNMNQIDAATLTAGSNKPKWMAQPTDDFIVGPGFQMAQCFVENIFESHIDWTELIMRDDNYKNIFQEKLQKEFKLTPHYLEIPLGSHISHLGGSELRCSTADDKYYTMGVFLCLGQSIHEMRVEDAMPISAIGKDIMDLVNYTQQHTKVFICFGIGQNKLKKKAEQRACHTALINLGELSAP